MRKEVTCRPTLPADLLCGLRRALESGFQLEDLLDRLRGIAGSICRDLAAQERRRKVVTALHEVAWDAAELNRAKQRRWLSRHRRSAAPAASR